VGTVGRLFGVACSRFTVGAPFHFFSVSYSPFWQECYRSMGPVSRIRTVRKEAKRCKTVQNGE